MISRLFFAWRPGWRGGYVAIEAAVNSDGVGYFQDVKSKALFSTLQEAETGAKVYHSIKNVKRGISKAAFPYQKFASILFMTEWEHPARVERERALQASD